MRIPAPLLALLAGILLLTPTSAQDKEGAGAKQDNRQSTEKIRELQKERIAALRAMAEISAALFKSGASSPESLLEARVLVGEAELDAAETLADRIAVSKKLVDALKECEEMAKVRKATAAGTETEVLKAKARRLEAEIRLERLQGSMPRQAKKAEPENQRIVVARLQAQDVTIAERFVCRIHAQRQIAVRSLQTGYLEEIQVREGQAVKQGDVLFRISPLLYKAKLEAELAEVELASVNLKTTERLFQNKVASQEEVALAKAKLAGAQAKATLAKAELEYTIVRAPFDGLIDRLHEQQGSLVTDRETLTTLSDNRVMWVYFNMPETCYLEYMASPRKDQPLPAELMLADGRKFPEPGKIAAVEAQFDSQTGTIPFRADFPNPEGLLRHGMTGNVTIRRTIKSALVVPQRATFEVEGKRYVYVIGEKDVAQQREIVVQREQGDNFILQQGLDDNDKIVIDGIRQIRDGQKVEYELR